MDLAIDNSRRSEAAMILRPCLQSSNAPSLKTLVHLCLVPSMYYVPLRTRQYYSPLSSFLGGFHPRSREIALAFARRHEEPFELVQYIYLSPVHELSEDQRRGRRVGTGPAAPTLRTGTAPSTLSDRSFLASAHTSISTYLLVKYPQYFVLVDGLHLPQLGWTDRPPAAFTR